MRTDLSKETAVVLFHNHPSGKPEPSTADGAITLGVKQS